MNVGMKAFAAALTLAGTVMAGPANAAMVVSFTFSDSSGNLSSSGSFSYPDALDGTSIGFGDLLSYSITFATSGRTYDLPFLLSGSFDATFYDMDFNSATDTFTALSGAGFDWYMSAIKATFDSGFFIGVGPSFGVATYDPPFTGEINADVYTVSKRNVSDVPVPHTALLLGAGLVLLPVLRRRAG